MWKGRNRWLLAAILTALLPACASEQADGSGIAGPVLESTRRLVEATRVAALPLTGAAQDFDALLAMVGEADVVLLGEATHGTQEFYEARARITRRLIEEKGFDAVLVEGDWPEALPVNRYVRSEGDARSAREALAAFRGFPTWMWRNTEVAELVDWLRARNTGRAPEAQVGFYGIDLQTFSPAMEEVIAFLEEVDPAAAERARERYGCLRAYGGEPQAYAEAVERRGARGCLAQLEAQVADLEALAAPLERSGGGEAYFGALQSARMLVRAEGYFRGMFRPGVNTWNLRDTWMADVAGTMRGRHGGGQKVVVWAHNSHVGDARATQMGENGDLNLGQLARERWGTEAVLVGFTTYTGSVLAADSWGGAPETKQVRPALPESFEGVFHETGTPSFLLPLRASQGAPVVDLLREPRLERAIGVIYLPQTERQSHYFHARMADQFDAVIHYDQTRALEPLDPASRLRIPFLP